MNKYYSVNLKEILSDNALGESFANNIISRFQCPLNIDVENFIKYKSIEFTKQGILSTYLVFTSFQNKKVLVGYFTLSNKILCVSKDSMGNSKWRHRIAKFGRYDTDIKKYIISASLIGQLGKNYTNSYNKLISGDELLDIALSKVKEMQLIVGGKIVYLECEDNQYLLEFYSNNGFVNFGRRNLDKDEFDISGSYLIQLLKYL